MPADFLTPPDVPEDEDCRTLKIPSSKYWLGIFNSALLMLTEPWRWQQVNAEDLTVDETIDLIKPMIEDYWNTGGCATCTLPDGEPVVRLSASGNWEQLVNGEWVPPEGDYELPPPAPREEPTEDERKCAASANAANVLSTMYESITDSAANALPIAEGVLALAGVVIAVLVPPVGALMTFLYAVAPIAFGELFAVAEFITEDVWTEDFTKQLICALLNSSFDDGSTVTFDFVGLQKRLVAGTDFTLPSLPELRLLGQIGYMLNIIGAEGLNIAGGTTAITDADCSDCPAEWCRYIDMSEGCDTYGWIVNDGECDEGHSILGVHSGIYNSLVDMQTDVLPYFTLTSMDVIMSIGGGTANSAKRIRLYDETGVIVDYAQIPVSNVGAHISFLWEGEALINQISLVLTTGSGSTDTVAMERIVLRGTGAAPDLGKPC